MRWAAEHKPIWEKKENKSERERKEIFRKKENRKKFQEGKEVRKKIYFQGTPQSMWVILCLVYLLVIFIQSYFKVQIFKNSLNFGVLAMFTIYFYVI